MKFVLLLSGILVLLTTDLVAQQAKLHSQNTNFNYYSSPKLALLTQPPLPQEIKRKEAPKDVNIYILPLFGEFEKTHTQKIADEEFLKSCDFNFKNRSEASDFFAARAWEYLSEGERDTAIHRFNLAYLLNEKNPDVYWGLGVIAYQSDKYIQAIRLMKNGLKIDDNNPTLVVDLATVYIKCFTLDAEKEDLRNAFELLNETLLKQQESPNALMQLSLAKLLNNEVDEAWERFHEGYGLDPDNASIEILQGLLARKDDPKGIFKHKNSR